MPRVIWPLQDGHPVVQVVLLASNNGHGNPRALLADTGAGAQDAPFDLVLSEDDGQRFSLGVIGAVRLGRAYTGTFPLVLVRASVPALQVTRLLSAVPVPASSLPGGMDGIASFHLLNTFGYGNFGRPGQFGLETLRKG